MKLCVFSFSPVCFFVMAVLMTGFSGAAVERGSVGHDVVIEKFSRMLQKFDMMNESIDCSELVLSERVDLELLKDIIVHAISDGGISIPQSMSSSDGLKYR